MIRSLSFGFCDAVWSFSDSDERCSNGKRTCIQGSPAAGLPGAQARFLLRECLLTVSFNNVFLESFLKNFFKFWPLWGPKFEEIFKKRSLFAAFLKNFFKFWPLWGPKFEEIFKKRSLNTVS